MANATGIGFDEIDQKITAVAAPFYTEDDTQDTGAGVDTLLGRQMRWIILIGAGLIALIILILIIVALIRRRKRRFAAEEMETGPIVMPETQDKEEGKDILTVQNERSRELRENIRDFAETNPEISAQMLRTWLNGGKEDGADTN